MIDKATKAAQGVFLWLDDRPHIAELWEHTAGHHIPKKSASWFYVFGSATLLCLVIQLITGTLLAFAYVPSGAEAFTTLHYLTFEVFVVEIRERRVQIFVDGDCGFRAHAFRIAPHF